MRDSRKARTPEFGNRDAGASYVDRAGAYAIIRDRRGRVAVVQTRTGLHLPGGGCETGEGPHETLAREVLEECGIVISDPRYLCKATQYVHAPGEGYFAKHCSYYVVESFERTRDATESGHRTRWLELARAKLELHFDSHRWALSQLPVTSRSEED
jgi:8-oxo-dGTP pyrophosphatase MutT (NUDIX family)